MQQNEQNQQQNVHEFWAFDEKYGQLTVWMIEIVSQATLSENLMFFFFFCSPVLVISFSRLTRNYTLGARETSKVEENAAVAKISRYTPFCWALEKISVPPTV